jgi:hypothetical protein
MQTKKKRKKELQSKKKKKLINSKGFFGFAIVLAMSLILFQANYGLQKSFFETEKTKNELIKAEQANKERTLLENNTDKIIYIKLLEQIITKNYNRIKARNEINIALENYLKNKAEAKTIYGEKTGEITLDCLNENSEVFILPAKHVVYAEYAYTSDKTKTNIVGKKLGNEIKTEFKIPIGSTTRLILPDA